MGSSASLPIVLVVVVVLVVGWGRTGCERMDGWTDGRGKEASGGIKEKNARFACTTTAEEEGRRRLGNKLAPMGSSPGSQP
jgi:hypothetical protein